MTVAAGQAAMAAAMCPAISASASEAPSGRAAIRWLASSGEAVQHNCTSRALASPASAASAARWAADVHDASMITDSPLASSTAARRRSSA